MKAEIQSKGDTEQETEDGKSGKRAMGPLALGSLEERYMVLSCAGGSPPR